MATAASGRPGGDDAALQRTVSRALALLARHAAARALAELGDIALPDLESPPPAARDPALLAPVGPLYLAHELEQAGLLRTAELIAGLFASGAITQSLGATADLLHEFWRTRRERLTADERTHLLAQLFEPQAFYPRMERLCAALAAMADNVDASDLREEVGLEQAAWDLVGLLTSRAGGIFAYAAGDILGAVKAALTFMRDRTLQTAFGARDLWDLVATAGSTQGMDDRAVRNHADLGRAGASVLVWLSGAAGGSPRIDPGNPQAQALIAAAVRWQMTRQPDPGAGAPAVASREPVAA